ncbi:Zn(2)-C6 fungal-type domain-containing protein [Mycena kentingensis (nom. inval.)]|nr:Zn(2)-C6 fungal-type domain-containing protein [Mycena kentingensis (nom. inval.)]
MTSSHNLPTNHWTSYNTNYAPVRRGPGQKREDNTRARAPDKEGSVYAITIAAHGEDIGVDGVRVVEVDSAGVGVGVPAENAENGMDVGCGLAKIGRSVDPRCRLKQHQRTCKGLKVKSMHIFRVTAAKRAERLVHDELECTRAAEDCEYVTGGEKAKVEILQDRISTVQNRIRHLEGSSGSTPLLLHQPYPQGNTSAPVSESMREPSVEIARKLVDTFLPSSADLGFFLDALRFRQSAFQNGATRPAPAILATVYLWGLRMTNQPELITQHESGLLARALLLTATGLGVSGSAPRSSLIMHTLQAHVLLAYYFLAIGARHATEAKYHTSAAVAMRQSMGLNLLRSANGTGASSGSPLGPSRDAIEEGERIQACWAVTTLDNLCAILTSGEATMNLRYSDACVLDTPWPLELHDYELGRMHPTARYSRTIVSFLEGIPGVESATSTLAVLSKAAILWERADMLMRDLNMLFSLGGDLTDPRAERVRKPYLKMNERVDAFLQELRAASSGSTTNTTPAMGRVRLPIGFDSERKGKRLAAATAILDLAASTTGPVTTFSNPIMGRVWKMAVDVVKEEIAGRAVQQSAALRRLLDSAMGAMARFKGFEES